MVRRLLHIMVSGLMIAAAAFNRVAETIGRAATAAIDAIAPPEPGLSLGLACATPSPLPAMRSIDPALYQGNRHEARSARTGAHRHT